MFDYSRTLTSKRRAMTMREARRAKSAAILLCIAFAGPDDFKGEN